MEDKVIWNKNNTKCVRASCIKYLAIYDNEVLAKLHGNSEWTAGHGCDISLGKFDVLSAAQQFVKDASKKIEEVKYIETEAKLSRFTSIEL